MKVKANEPATMNEIYVAAQRIADARIRALFVFEYLSGGRVGEILKRCQKKHIEYVTKLGKDWMMLKMPYTEKNKEHPSRNIPIPIEHEKQFIELLQPYFETLGDDDILFNFGRVTAWRKISPIVLSIKEKGIGKHRHKNANHYLRHCRASHLVEYYNYDLFDLMKVFGWSDGRPAETYVKKSTDSMMRKMM